MSILDLFRRKRTEIVPGVMWEGRRGLRPLSLEEYQFWMMIPLPFGWSIVAVPQRIERKEREA